MTCDVNDKAVTNCDTLEMRALNFETGAGNTARRVRVGCQLAGLDVSFACGADRSRRSDHKRQCRVASDTGLSSSVLRLHGSKVD